MKNAVYRYASLSESLYKERVEDWRVRVAGANVINVPEGWPSCEALSSYFNPFNRMTVTCATISRMERMDRIEGEGAADHYAWGWSALFLDALGKGSD